MTPETKKDEDYLAFLERMKNGLENEVSVNSATGDEIQEIVDLSIEKASQVVDDPKIIAKKSLKKVFKEAGLAGVFTAILLFGGCRAPLPMIMAALEVTQATGDACTTVTIETAIGTILLEFIAGSGAYLFVRLLSRKSKSA